MRDQPDLRSEKAGEPIERRGHGEREQPPVRVTSFFERLRGPAAEPPSADCLAVWLCVPPTASVVPPRSAPGLLLTLCGASERRSPAACPRAPYPLDALPNTRSSAG